MRGDVRWDWGPCGLPITARQRVPRQHCRVLGQPPPEFTFRVGAGSPDIGPPVAFGFRAGSGRSVRTWRGAIRRRSGPAAPPERPVRRPGGPLLLRPRPGRRRSRRGPSRPVPVPAGRTCQGGRAGPARPRWQAPGRGRGAREWARPARAHQPDPPTSGAVSELGVVLVRAVGQVSSPGPPASPGTSDLLGLGRLLTSALPPGISGDFGTIIPPPPGTSPHQQQERGRSPASDTQTRLITAERRAEPIPAVHLEFRSGHNASDWTRHTIDDILSLRLDLALARAKPWVGRSPTTRRWRKTEGQAPSGASGSLSTTTWIDRQRGTAVPATSPLRQRQFASAPAASASPATARFRHLPGSSGLPHRTSTPAASTWVSAVPRAPSAHLWHCVGPEDASTSPRTSIRAQAFLADDHPGSLAAAASTPLLAAAPRCPSHPRQRPLPVAKLAAWWASYAFASHFAGRPPEAIAAYRAGANPQRRSTCPCDHCRLQCHLPPTEPRHARRPSTSHQRPASFVPSGKTSDDQLRALVAGGRCTKHRMTATIVGDTTAVSGA